jgi:hypothetical protein
MAEESADDKLLAIKAIIYTYDREIERGELNENLLNRVFVKRIKEAV